MSFFRLLLRGVGTRQPPLQFNAAMSALLTQRVHRCRVHHCCLIRYMLPFHVNLSATSGECMGAPAMSFPTDVKMRNEGRMDAWNTARNPGYGMGYAAQIPFFFKLKKKRRLF